MTEEDKILSTDLYGQNYLKLLQGDGHTMYLGQLSYRAKTLLRRGDRRDHMEFQRVRREYVKWMRENDPNVSAWTELQNWLYDNNLCPMFYPRFSRVATFNMNPADVLATEGEWGWRKIADNKTKPTAFCSCYLTKRQWNLLVSVNFSPRSLRNGRVKRAVVPVFSAYDDFRVLNIVLAEMMLMPVCIYDNASDIEISMAGLDPIQRKECF